MARAALIEVFDSIQGEGRFVGMPMAFLRVATCPIRCLYCDTPESYRASPTFSVRGADAADRSSRAEPNPVEAARALEILGEVRRGRDVAVSVTGGEPLAVPDFVAELGRLVRADGGRVHLETAALDPDAMRNVVAAIDHVSADYKLPGTLRDGDPRSAHRACFEVVAASGASLDIKIVLTNESTRDRRLLADTLEQLAPWRDRCALVLQPVTPFGAVTERVPTDALVDWYRGFEERGFDVRVIPQTHKTLGVE